MATLGLQPGDTIVVPGGDYAYLHLGNITGTAAAPVVVINQGRSGSASITNYRAATQ